MPKNWMWLTVKETDPDSGELRFDSKLIHLTAAISISPDPSGGSILNFGPETGEIRVSETVDYIAMGPRESKDNEDEEDNGKTASDA